MGSVRDKERERREGLREDRGNRQQERRGEGRALERRWFEGSGERSHGGERKEQCEATVAKRPGDENRKRPRR